MPNTLGSGITVNGPRCAAAEITEGVLNRGKDRTDADALKAAVFNGIGNISKCKALETNNAKPKWTNP